jgi:L-malate glycosyltransferase
MSSVIVIPSWFPDKENEVKGSFFLDQALSLKNHGCNVSVIYIQIKSLRGASLNSKMFEYSNEVEHGIRTIRVTTFNLTPSSSFGLILQHKLIAYIVSKYCISRGIIASTDIVHAHSNLFGGVIARVVSNTYNCEYILTEHRRADITLIDKHERKEFLSTIYNASCVVSPSKSFHKYMIRNYKVNPLKSIVIPNMIPEPFENDDTQIIKSSYFTFVFIGWLIPLKRPQDLLNSIKQIIDMGYKCRLIICGSGSMIVDLELLSKKLKIESHVIFKGMLSRSSIQDTIKKSNCLCSTSERETFGVSMLEAISMGVPVIASKSGGSSDIVNFKNGVLFDVGDVPGLTKAMEYMINNIKHYKVSEIRADAIERFSRKKITEDIISLYDKNINTQVV